MLVDDYEKATKFGNLTNPDGRKCKSSFLPVDNEEYELNADIEHLGDNGQGYTLYFLILKFVIIALCCTVVPLAIGMCILFRGGDDCAQVNGLLQDQIDEKNARRGIPAGELDIPAHDAFLKNRPYTYGTVLQYARQPPHKTHDFSLNVLSLLFNDVDGDGLEISEIFEQSIGYSTYDYLKRFFEYVCRDQDEEEKRPLDPEYRNFCKEYYEQGCIDEPKTKACTRKRVNFYSEKNVAFSCEMSWINLISLSNRIEKKDRKTKVDSMLPLAYQAIFYLMVVGILAFQWWQLSYIRQLDDQVLEIGDISLLLTDLPTGDEVNEVSDLETSIKHAFAVLDYEIKSINFIYDCDEYMKIKEKLVKKRTELAKKNYEKRQDHGEMSDEQRMENKALISDGNVEILKLEQRMADIEQKFEEQDEDLMTGKAFISFATTDQRNTCYNKCQVEGIKDKVINFFVPQSKQQILLFLNEPRRVHVELPYEPNDIIWEDLKYKWYDKLWRRLVSSFIGYSIVIIGFYLLYRFKTGQVSFS